MNNGIIIIIIIIISSSSSKCRKCSKHVNNICKKWDNIDNG